MLNIIANGRFQTYEEPIEVLFDSLKRYTLDPRHSDSPISPAWSGTARYLPLPCRWVYTYKEPIYPESPCAISFSGAFYGDCGGQGGFRVDTDEPDIIECLTVLILANMETDAYKQAKAECLAAQWFKWEPIPVIHVMELGGGGGGMRPKQDRG